jgi:NADPH:quinone reductase
VLEKMPGDTHTYHAIVMRQYGAPDVLRFETVPGAPLDATEVAVRTIAAAINHSDLEIRAGHWPIRRLPPFPYVPGLEVVGEVAAVGTHVTDVAVGDCVITMMQGLGGVRAERSGGYAEYVTVAADAVAKVRPDLDPIAVAALGLGSVTAFEGLRKLGTLNGRRILVTGAAGGVGSAAVGVAKAQGASVVALIARASQAEYVGSLGASEVVLSADVEHGALAASSLDGVLDLVAGSSFGTFVSALRPGRTLSLVGAVGGNVVSLDGYRLMDTTLTGYTSESLDGNSLRRAISAITSWLHSGELQVPAHTEFPLDRAAEAHSASERGALGGRILLVP